ncbi:MAG: class I SAM-dependent methyltransferase [Burkholderiaceae bacterium]
MSTTASATAAHRPAVTPTTGMSWQAGTPCPCCGESAAQVVATRDGKTGEALLTVECARCGLGRIDPLPTPEALADWYAHHYRQEYKGAVQPALRHVLRAGRNALLRWDWLQRHQLALPWTGAAHCGRSLDIGASSGEFVALMREVGIDAHGIEPHAGYAGYAQQSMQLQILHGPLQQRLLDFAPASLDLVTMFHVLEHLVDPLPTLRQIADRLSPGGVLYIEVPNATRPCSPHYMFFRAHVLYFTGLSLRQTLQAAGLQVLAHSADDADNLSIVARRADAPQAPVFEHRPDLVQSQRQRRWIPYLWDQVLEGQPFARIGQRLEEKRTARQFSAGPVLLKSLYARSAAST